MQDKAENENQDGNNERGDEGLSGRSQDKEGGILNENDHGFCVIPKNEGFRLSNILYYIGALTILVGIYTFLTLKDGALNLEMALLITSGSAIASYIIGVLFSGCSKMDPIGRGFFLISLPMASSAIFFALLFMGIKPCTLETLIWTSSILLVTSLVSYMIFGKNVFIPFVAIYGTLLFFLLCELLNLGQYFPYSRFIVYQVIFVAFVYILTGYIFSRALCEPQISGTLYGFGAFLLLGGAFFLSDVEMKMNMDWVFGYPILLFFAFVTGILLRSKSIIVFGILYLLAYFTLIANEAFMHSECAAFTTSLCGLGVIVFGLIISYMERKDDDTIDA